MRIFSNWYIFLFFIVIAIGCSDNFVMPEGTTQQENSSQTPPSTKILINHSKNNEHSTTDHTFNYETDTMFNMVKHAGPNALSCQEFEIEGRTSTIGRCNDINNWTSMSSTDWVYDTYNDTWTISHKLFNHPFLVAGTYHSYWKNPDTGQQAVYVSFIQINGSRDLHSVSIVDSLSKFGLATRQFSTQDIMFRRIYNAGPNAIACQEFKSTASDNFDGSCDNISKWFSMMHSDWVYHTNAQMWTKMNILTNSPLKPGYYKSFWKNPNTAAVGVTTFSIQ